MSTVALIIAIFSGSLGCGFLFAGILMLRDFVDSDADNKHQRARLIGELLDALFLFGAITTAHDTAMNWRRRRPARRFIYAGFGTLLLMSAALYLR
jgi:hypothetical protein